MRNSLHSMVSIGPQPPSHLQTRRRNPDDNNGGISPAFKMRRADDDDDNSEYGLGLSALSCAKHGNANKSASIKPSVGPSSPPLETAGPPSPSTRTYGPSLLPTSADADETFLENSDSDTGSQPSRPAPPPKRIIGPASPPALLDQCPDTGLDSDSDSYDGYGPALPSAENTSCKGKTPRLPAESTPAALQRDNWMLAPSTETGFRITDTTKIRARSFALGRSVRKNNGGFSSIWTETAEEKKRRLANAVLGRGIDEQSATSDAGDLTASLFREQKRKAVEEGARVRAYNETRRTKSLYEEHQDRKKRAKAEKSSGLNRRKPGAHDGEPEEEEDDPSKRAFDIEKDMAVESRDTARRRRELLRRAVDFNGRFERGKYL